MMTVKGKNMTLELKNNPTLSDYQDYIRQMKQERGFNTTDKFYECCLLAEECGELISAISVPVRLPATLPKSWPMFSFISALWPICTILIWNRLSAPRKKKTNNALGSVWHKPNL